MHVQRNQVSAIIATSSGVTEQTEDDLSQLRPFILQLKAVNYFLKKRRYKDAAKALPRSAPELLEGFENLRTWHKFLKAELPLLSSTFAVKEDVKDCVKGASHQITFGVFPPNTKPANKLDTLVSAIATTSQGVIKDTDLKHLQSQLASRLQLPQVAFKQCRFILRLELTNYFLGQGRYEDAAKALPRSACKLPEGLGKLNLHTWHEFLKAELLVLGSDHSNRFLIPSIPSSPIPSSSILLPSQVLKTCAAAAAAVRSPPLTIPQVIGTACTPTELSRFETDPTSFESFHPELSEMERYSLLLNLAIIKQRVPLVEQLLTKLGSTNYGLTALTCVDIGMLSPVTQLLLFENPQILRLIEQFIDTQGENNRVKFRASDRELANMMSSFRFLKKKDEPLRYFKVLESLYDNLDRVSEFLKEIRVLC